jgi:hypothetical protein
MSPEIKEALKNLSVKELIEILQDSDISKSNSFSRFTIGKLDCQISGVINERKKITEYEIKIPKGVLCNVWQWNDAENMIKEINNIIIKYQK